MQQTVKHLHHLVFNPMLEVEGRGYFTRGLYDTSLARSLAGWLAREAASVLTNSLEVPFSRVH